MDGGRLFACWRPARVDAYVTEDRTHERFLTAERFLQRGELLEARHFRHAMGVTPGGDLRELHVLFVGGIGAGFDQGSLDVAPTAVLGLGLVRHHLAVARRMIHQTVECGILSREGDIGDPDLDHHASLIFNPGAPLGDRLAELPPAFLGYSVQQLAFVLEVVVGSSRTDAGFPRHRAKRQRCGTFRLENSAAGHDKGPGQIAVMIGATAAWTFQTDLAGEGFKGGVSNFAHGLIPKTIS